MSAMLPRRPSRGGVDPAAERCGRMTCYRRPPAAFRRAQRFFCASLIRLRAAADILRRPPGRLLLAPAAASPRRAAQYFFIRSLTAFRLAADIPPRRRDFPVLALRAAPEPACCLNSGNAR